MKLDMVAQSGKRLFVNSLSYERQLRRIRNREKRSKAKRSVMVASQTTN